MDEIINQTGKYGSFGEFIKAKREALGKSIRGLAAELDITPAYLSDIEKDNRYAPEKFLDKMAALLHVPQDELNEFYDLAGKSRNHNYPDLTEYIGNTRMARVALRLARDLDVTDEGWQKWIDEMNGSKR